MDPTDFLSDLYEGIDASDYWQRAADTIARWSDPEGVCHLMVSEADSAPHFHVLSSNRSPKLLAVYRETFLEHDVRVPLALARSGTFTTGTELVGESAFEQSAIVNDFLDKPDVDVRWSLGRSDELTNSRRFLLALLRPRQRQRFAEADIRRAGVIAPHMLQIARLKQKLDDSLIDGGRLTGAANQLHEPIIVLDRLLNVKFRNAAAEQAFRDNHALLSARDGRLSARMAQDQRNLEAAVRLTAQLRDGNAALAPRPLVFQRDDDGRPHILVLSFQALPRTDEFGGGSEVMITLSPSERANSDLRALSVLQALGCSPAELDTALAFAQGASLGEIAAARSIGLETIRTQMKAAIRKSGCGGQGDFLRFLRRYR